MAFHPLGLQKWWNSTSWKNEKVVMEPFIEENLAQRFWSQGSENNQKTNVTRISGLTDKPRDLKVSL